MTISRGIEFDNITKSYGTGANAPLAVKGISFSIAQGTLTTLLGPSGCGKTTTLRMIAGLEQPTSGKILIGGQDVTGLSPAQRNVSMVFQSYALFPHMNVLDNVSYGLLASGLAKPQAKAKALVGLKSVGLQDYSDRWPSELSGGQQQRVAVARALVLEPAVLLFDEPLSNLDAKLRRSMREEIRALQQKLALTVVYVTHDQEEAMAVSDKIIIMHEGLIAQKGSPRQLYERPDNEFVAAFMGDALLLDVQAVDADYLQLSTLTIHKPAHGIAANGRVAIRPQAWKIADVDNPGAQGLMAAQLVGTSYLGSHLEYQFITPIGRLWMMVPSTIAPLSVGAEVALTVDTAKVALLRQAVLPS